MSREPPSTARLVALLARVALRRMGNRIASRSLIFRRRRGGADGKARGATPGKSTGSVLFLSALGVLFLFQGMMISGQLLGRIGLTVAREGDPGDLRFPVHASSYRSLVGLKQRLDEFHERHSRQASSPPEELDRFVEDRMTELRGELTVEIHSAGKWRASSDGDWKLSDEGEAKLAEMVRAFRERGPDAFRSLPPRRAHFLPDALHWPEPAGERAFLLALGVLLTILFSSLLCVSLGSANQDLGRVEWSMEWLYSFPVTARSLFLAKILEYTIVTAFPWFTLFPLSLTIFWAAGYQWWAVALALMTTLYLNLLLASLRFTAETWLRKRLSLARLKNLQALFTVLGLLLLYLVLYVAIRDELPAWVLGAARGVPGAILWSPVALPLLLTAKNAAVALLLPLLLVAGGGFLAAGSVASARVVRDGLLSAGGPYQGSRRKPRSGDRPSSWSWAMSGILGKEMRLLARDRNFLVQTLVVPLLIIGFQVLINPQLVGAVSGNFRHGATLAFGIGAYVLMFGGCSVLTVEGSSLWLLYTFPRPLGTILRQKALLWSIAGGFYVTVILSVVAVNAERLDGTTLAAASMALAGVVIYAFIAAGLGILGTNPLEQEVRRKIRPGTMYLYMLLASMYAYGIYAPSAWSKLSLVILCSLLAHAIWQKVHDRIPFLLDPTVAPPPRITLSDGLVASLAFFVIQGIVVLSIQKGSNGAPPHPVGWQLTIGFLAAGVLVVLGSFYSFWRRRVPELLVTLGLRGGKEPRSSALGALGSGLLHGLAAAACGCGYLLVIDHIPALAGMKRLSLEFAAQGAAEETWWWLVGLAVLAAPLFEEFIFRGMVFRGLRRTWPAGVSALASAAVFAAIHPPISVIPVFILGLAAARSFERWGLLIAPIAAHMVYNGAVIFMGLLLGS